MLILDHETGKVHELPSDTRCVPVRLGKDKWVEWPAQTVDEARVVALGTLNVYDLALVYDDDTTFWRLSQVVE